MFNVPEARSIDCFVLHFQPDALEATKCLLSKIWTPTPTYIHKGWSNYNSSTIGIAASLLQVQEVVKKYGFPVVIKPLKGSCPSVPHGK